MSTFPSWPPFSFTAKYKKSCFTFTTSFLSLFVSLSSLFFSLHKTVLSKVNSNLTVTQHSALFLAFLFLDTCSSGDTFLLWLNDPIFLRDSLSVFFRFTQPRKFEVLPGLVWDLLILFIFSYSVSSLPVVPLTMSIYWCFSVCQPDFSSNTKCHSTSNSTCLIAKSWMFSTSPTSTHIFLQPGKLQDLSVRTTLLYFVALARNLRVIYNISLSFISIQKSSPSPFDSSKYLSFPLSYYKVQVETSITVWLAGYYSCQLACPPIQSRLLPIPSQYCSQNNIFKTQNWLGDTKSLPKILLWHAIILKIKYKFSKALRNLYSDTSHGLCLLFCSNLFCLSLVPISFGFPYALRNFVWASLFFLKHIQAPALL